MPKDVIERIRVRIEGVRPLLMHSPGAMNIKSERKGVQIDPRKEAEASLYRDDDGKIVVPAINILAAMREAAKEYKVPGRGRKTFRDYIYAGLRITPDMIPLQVPNGQDPETAWEVDIRPVVVQRSRIMRARPRFDEWALEFDIEILDPIIRASNVKEFLESAGKYIGLCDFRPLFGQFKVTKFEVAKSAR